MSKTIKGDSLGMKNKTAENFETVVSDAIGDTRSINDGGTCDGETFVVDRANAPGIAETLAAWWDEKYGTEPDENDARDYFDDVYPPE